MATWQEVQERVRAEYTLDSDEKDELALTMHRRDENGARAQRVMVRRYEAWGEQLVEIRSAFAQAGDFDPEKLLSDTLQLPLGAIAQHGRFLVLVHKASLAHTSVDGVLFLLARVSMLADVLEERRGGDRF